jgi:hypothetical protein
MLTSWVSGDQSLVTSAATRFGESPLKCCSVKIQGEFFASGSSVTLIPLT